MVYFKFCDLGFFKAPTGQFRPDLQVFVLAQKINVTPEEAWKKIRAVDGVDK